MDASFDVTKATRTDTQGHENGCIMLTEDPGATNTNSLFLHFSSRAALKRFGLMLVEAAAQVESESAIRV